MPIYQMRTYTLPSPGQTRDAELVDILEFELSTEPESSSVFAILKAYDAERKREDESSVFQLLDILDELAELKAFPSTEFGRIASSETDREAHAKTARERIITYAIRYLDAGSYDTIADVLEPSVLDRPDVQAIIPSPERMAPSWLDRVDE